MEGIIAWIKGVYEKLSNIADEVLPSINDMFEWFQDAFNWFVDFLMDFPKWIFNELCQGIVEFFEALPVPSFFASASNAFNGIPPSVVFFADAFQIGPGITMVLLAFLLRFIIRRIPIIG